MAAVCLSKHVLKLGVPSYEWRSLLLRGSGCRLFLQKPKTSFENSAAPPPDPNLKEWLVLSPASSTVRVRRVLSSLETPGCTAFEAYGDCAVGSNFNLLGFSFVVSVSSHYPAARVQQFSRGQQLLDRGALAVTRARCTRRLNHDGRRRLDNDISGTVKLHN